ncbi:hypothetical protein GCM10012275_02110 [Longimycelium tulufanense]|uniref:dTDP-6-deoxy-L-hexose 3-O-methyltransferase n=1 Tax=Longimycelium tulufanense TaxID=907463 RepID=A0A8J3C8M5_9PSEU|nr:hypothetical protein [Longimycelium tulufanense]GGM34352.1 hypothetical protein GCM10012275_02110 [Longimycelium tulufanense]
MTNDQADDRILPRESSHERTVRHCLAELLSLDALYRMILDIPGVIMEFGLHRGRHLAALTALRGVHEPCNPHRRIIGFDTFTGFPDVTDIDTTSPSAAAGRFALTDGYPHHLHDVLNAHEQG